MHIQIEDERVRRNVLFFLHLLSIVETAKAEQDLRSARKEMRTYRAFLNKINGEIFFPDLLPEDQILQSKEWKKIEVQCLPDPEGKDLIFAIVEQEEGQFGKEDLEPLACRVMRNTVHTLNHVSSVMRKTLTIQKGLAELAKLHIQRALGQMELSTLQRLSRPVNRWQAEEILSRHPYGSFLFRKDEYADVLEEVLQKSHGRVMTCYTLSFSEKMRKVTDLTLVLDGGHILIYNDDPSLEGKRYHSLQEVLESLQHLCKYPLF